MNPLWATIWGLAGGLCVEGLGLYRCIRTNEKWSWRQPLNMESGLAPYLWSVAIRIGVGGLLVVALTTSGQVCGVGSAFLLGAAAPYALERIARQIPLAHSEFGLCETPAITSGSTSCEDVHEA